jgi:hypothetical protein
MPNISDLEWIAPVNKLASGVTRLALEPGQRFPKARQHLRRDRIVYVHFCTPCETEAIRARFSEATAARHFGKWSAS